MSNEQENENSENEQDLEADLETEGEEIQEEKPKKEYSTEQKLARVERMREKYIKELGLNNEPKETKPDTGAKSGEFNEGQLALLVAKGIEDDAEVALVKEYMKNTGKPLMEVVKSKFFTNDLSDLRESKKAMEATPKGSRRSGSSGKDDASYWFDKVESGQAKLSDIPDRETREKVVNLRIAKNKNNSPFL